MRKIEKREKENGKQNAFPKILKPEEKTNLPKLN